MNNTPHDLAELADGFFLKAYESGLINAQDFAQMEMLADTAAGEGAFADAARARLIASAKNLMVAAVRVWIQKGDSQ